MIQQNFVIKGNVVYSKSKTELEIKEQAYAVCKESGEKYRLFEGVVTLCWQSIYKDDSKKGGIRLPGSSFLYLFHHL